MRLKWRQSMSRNQLGKWPISCAREFWDYYRSANTRQHVQFSSKCYTFICINFHTLLHWLYASHTLIHVFTPNDHKCFSQLAAGLGTRHPPAQSNLLLHHLTQQSSLHSCIRLLFFFGGETSCFLHFILWYWSHGTLFKKAQYKQIPQTSFYVMYKHF